MKIIYTGPDDYMARIRNGDVFDVLVCSTNAYGRPICYEVLNSASECVYIDANECMVMQGCKE